MTLTPLVRAPENLNLVRKIAMNLLRLSPLKKTLRKKRLKACLNHQYLEENCWALRNESS